MPQRLSIDEWKQNKILRGDIVAELMTFLEKLDASELVLTDWEARFVASYLQGRSEGRGQDWFSDGRIMSACQMQEKYHVELKLPGTVKFNTPQVKRDLSAKAGCCMYLVNEPGHPQRPCNEPATCQTPLRQGYVGQARGGFRYCRTHHDIAAEACRRKKVPFSVQPLTIKTEQAKA